MMEYIPSDTRGGGDYGWLKTCYSFSFANYYDPMKMGFGTLRVINDDWIGPQSGFGEHEHSNMEIITIPFTGALSHKDSTGGEGNIEAGEVQVMSAGTGVVHSEYNHTDAPVELFQIWIEPRSYGIKPRYDQKKFDFEHQKNALVLLVSADGQSESLTIHQDVRVFRGVYDEAREERVAIRPGKGMYLILRSGEVRVGEYRLTKGDALTVEDEEEFLLQVSPGTDLVLLEVPPLQHVL